MSIRRASRLLSFEEDTASLGATGRDDTHRFGRSAVSTDETTWVLFG
jgi:hypothetical protein